VRWRARTIVQLRGARPLRQQLRARSVRPTPTNFMPLKRADADCMLRILPVRETLRQRLEDFVSVGLPLTDADKSELRDLVADQLVLQGFDKNYELTPIGQRLEDLIDLLFVDKGAA